MANSTDSTSGSNPNSLGQSPWGRLGEVGITDLSSLFSGVGNQSSGGGNPFGDNPLGAQVLFGGGNNNGGSPFTNLRTNIDTLVGGLTSGSNPMSGGGDSVFSQSPTDGTSSGIPSFGGGTGSPIPIEGGGIGGGPSGDLSDPFAPGGAFGIPSAETFDFASYGIPTEGSFDPASYGIPTEGSFDPSGIPSFGGGGIGGEGSGIPSFGGEGNGIPSFGGEGNGIPSFGGGTGNGIPSFGTGSGSSIPFA
jgi:hypothetical protein